MALQAQALATMTTARLWSAGNRLDLGTASAVVSPVLIHGPNMKEGTKRTIFRWIHIVFAIPIAGYVYSPFEELPNYAPIVRFVALPVIVLTGLWMWKGQVLRRLVSKRSD